MGKKSKKGKSRAGKTHAGAGQGKRGKNGRGITRTKKSYEKNKPNRRSTKNNNRVASAVEPNATSVTTTEPAFVSFVESVRKANAEAEQKNVLREISPSNLNKIANIQSNGETPTKKFVQLPEKAVQSVVPFKDPKPEDSAQKPESRQVTTTAEKENSSEPTKVEPSIVATKEKVAVEKYVVSESAKKEPAMPAKSVEYVNSMVELKAASLTEPAAEEAQVKQVNDCCIISRFWPRHLHKWIE